MDPEITGVMVSKLGDPGFETKSMCIVPSGKVLILIKSLREDIKPSVPWFLTCMHTHALVVVVVILPGC